jgi:hypothetical protein
MDQRSPATAFAEIQWPVWVDQRQSKRPRNRLVRTPTPEAVVFPSVSLRRLSVPSKLATPDSSRKR